MNRKQRKRLRLLEAVALELIERIEALEGADEPPRWRDAYGPALDIDPKPPLSDELTFEAPPGVLWDDDEWTRGTYL